MQPVKVVLWAAILALVVSDAADAGVIYAEAGYYVLTQSPPSFVTYSDLYSIDSNTGIATYVGNSGHNGYFGLGYDTYY